MMSDCPLAIRHKKGEYIWIGDFVDRGSFLLFWSCEALDCIYVLHLVFIFFWLMIYFVLFKLSMIGGDILCLFLILVSHCATLIIDLYL